MSDKCSFCYNLITVTVQEEDKKTMEFVSMGKRDAALFKLASNIENVHCLLNKLEDQNTKKTSS